jgi:CheY-like chemotaxis protein
MASILVMDDDGVIRTAVRKILESAGYEGLDAAEGKTGLQLYREHGPDGSRLTRAGCSRPFAKHWKRPPE